MDYRSTPDPSSLPQVEYFPGSFRRNGTEGSLTTPGSSSCLPDPYTPFHGSEYPHPVLNTPNDQWPLCPPPSFPLKDHPLTQDQVPGPYYPNDSDPIYGARWGGTNMQMGRGQIADHLWEDHNLPSLSQDSRGAFGRSGPPAPLCTTIADSANTLLPSGGLCQQAQQSQVQDDYPHAISPSRGQVQSAAQSLVDAHATTQETSLERERRAQVKKERDKARKQIERSNNERDYLRICELLDIAYAPKNTLVSRNSVEGLVEQHNVDNDLRQRVINAEAYANFLKAKLTKIPTGEDIDSFLPFNAHATVDESDAGAAQHSWSWSNWKETMIRMSGT